MLLPNYVIIRLCKMAYEITNGQATSQEGRVGDLKINK
jgi:hypothetical protein